MKNGLKELIRSFFIFNDPIFRIYVIDANKLLVNWDSWYGKAPVSLTVPQVSIVSLALNEKQLIHLRKDKGSGEVRISVQMYINYYNVWSRFENTLTNDCDYIDIKHERKRKKQSKK